MGARQFYRKLKKKIENRKPSMVRQLVAKPFSRADLHPVPAGWKIGPPDFVGIGSARAGTSWWFSLILQHPSVTQNRLATKELYYFCHFAYKEVEESAVRTYNEAFASPVGSVCGEWTPNYLTYPLAVRNLVAAVPEVRLLVIVRNPVDRTISHVNHMMYHAGITSSDFATARDYYLRSVFWFPRAATNSLLSRPLREVFRTLDRSRVLILQYEKCRSNPESEIRKTFEFLGIDSSFLPSRLSESVNQAPYVVPKASMEERKRLAGYFADEAQSLNEMLPEIDFALWPDFH